MPAVDSSDMTPAYWLDIARAIAKRYDTFDGFVILHGTDTMAYTASALSFLLDNLEAFCIVDQKGRDLIRLHLSARESDKFRDLRGPGKLDFADFEQ